MSTRASSTRTGCILPLFLFSLFSLQILASTESRRERWLMPDGRRQEAEQSIVVGQSIELSWKALNDSTNDLWLMSMDEGDDVFTQPIAEKINISRDGSYIWTVNLQKGTVDAIDSYAFVFLPRDTEDYSPSDKRIPSIRSPTVLIVNNAHFSGTVRASLSTAEPGEKASATSSPTQIPTETPSATKSTPPTSTITVKAEAAAAAASSEESEEEESDDDSTNTTLLVAILTLAFSLVAVGMLLYTLARRRRRRLRAEQYEAEERGDYTSSMVEARRMSSILWD